MTDHHITTSPHHDMHDLLRRIDRETTVPPIDDSREAALLDAFDAARERLHPPADRSRWLAIAATLIVLGGSAVVWMVLRGRVAHPSQVASRDAEPAVGDFVLWPGAATLPPLESGRLVRMDLPATVLPALGVFPAASDVTVVRADVLFGQDGLARAFRFVSMSHNEVEP